MTIEEEAKEYAIRQCEDMYHETGLTGAEWGRETALDFISGAKSNSARRYWLKIFQGEEEQ